MTKWTQKQIDAHNAEVLRIDAEQRIIDEQRGIYYPPIPKIWTDPATQRAAARENRERRAREKAAYRAAVIAYRAEHKDK